VSSFFIALRQNDNLETAAQFSALGPADQFIIASTEYNIAMIDLMSPARVITTNAPTTADDPLAAGLWTTAMRHQGLSWFITWFPPASAENWQERELWQRASFVRETNLGDDRALLFDLHPTAEAAQRGGWRFGPLELATYGYQVDPDGLRVTLAWRSAETMDQDYSWFLHVLDGSGQIVQQQDRPPQGGYAPRSVWQVGDEIKDYLFFPVEADLNARQLRIGVIDPVNRMPVPVTDPAGQPLSDPFVLIPLS
jgi:hypothetical protein